MYKGLVLGGPRDGATVEVADKWFEAPLPLEPITNNAVGFVRDFDPLSTAAMTKEVYGYWPMHAADRDGRYEYGYWIPKKEHARAHAYIHERLRANYKPLTVDPKEVVRLINDLEYAGKHGRHLMGELVGDLVARAAKTLRELMHHHE